RARVRDERRERKQLHRLRREPSRTVDGVDIRIFANAESREDVAEAHALGAAGVGLYRTEFLFMGDTLPGEDAQFRAYRDVALGMTGRTVTIRTLDIGADKADRTGLALANEPNPALGLRGVRLSLARADIFETQMRAIVRASGYGPIRVLVPMVSGREEIAATAALLKRVRRDLASEGHEIAEHIPLGAMIEVPAAAISLPGFIDAVDFLSVGTHDLVQDRLAGRRPQQRGTGRAVHAAAPGGAAPAGKRDPHCPTPRQAGGHVRRDGRRCAVRAPAAGTGAGGIQPASGHAAGGAPGNPRLRPGHVARPRPGAAARA